MTHSTIEFPVPDAPAFGRTLRASAVTAAGAALGLVGADALDVDPAVPAFVGMLVALMFATSRGPSEREGFAAQVLLVAGCGALAGVLVDGWSPTAAFVPAAVGAGLAVATSSSGGSVRRAAQVLVPALMAGFALLAVLFLEEGSRLFWGVDPFWVAATAGAFVGMGAHAGGAAVRCATVRRTESEPHRLSTELVARAAVPAAGTVGDGAASSEVDDALESLELRARRVVGLLDQLTSERPDDAVLADEIRGTVDQTLGDARDAAARWRLTDERDAEARAAALGARIEANRRRLAEDPAPRVAAAIEAALVRQERALAACDEVATGRTAFRYRLDEAAAGLDVLQTAIGRAITAGDGVDQAEVDTLVDALADAHAFFDSEIPG